MAELLPISSPLAAERQLDVVFVHGLGGDPIETWRSGTDENTSWPHWLALEFGPQIGVWSLGYAAASSKWQGIPFFGGKDPDAGSAMSLPRRSENALDRLVGAGIGQRPVCFITHSLGGLLVKSILRRCADSQFAPERLQVVEQCRGVLFLATPHHGSRLADLAGAIKVYLPSVSTLDLKDNDDHLMDLYEWYRSYAPSHHILTRSYYENNETKGVVIVVPRSSADPGVAGETARGPTPLDRDHLEISKPRNRQDQAYIGSTQLIRLILSGEAPASGTGQPPLTSGPGNTASPSSAQPPPSPQPLPAQLASTTPVQAPQAAATNQVKVSGNRNITMTGVSAGGNINVGNSIQGDYVAGDKIIYNLASPSAGPATTPGTSPLKPGPWRVFLSHTSELRQYPQAGSYIAKAERAVSAAGHAIVDMADFAAIDQAPASVCIAKVKASDVYIGIYGLRYGSPVRDQPEISYTELEFNTATEMSIPRLVFLLDDDSEDHGLPAKALKDREYGDCQDVFLKRVRDAGLTLQRFRNPDDLKGLVERSLRELAESFAATASSVPGVTASPTSLQPPPVPPASTAPVQIPDCIEQSRTSPILYDARTSCKPSDFVGRKGQHWDANQRRHQGDVGEGKIEYSPEGLLSITRFNDLGRYDIELTRYNVNGRMYTTIPPIEDISTKRVTVSFEAITTGASFTCYFLFKIHPNGEIVHEIRTISESLHWSPCTISFHLEPRLSYTFRIYIMRVSGAPSEMQIRNLIIRDESF